jgi:hypothetical protein
MAEKSHVRYDPELRRPATPDECKFVAWAAALVQHREIRPVPDLEEMVRVHLDSQAASVLNTNTQEPQ